MVVQLKASTVQAAQTGEADPIIQRLASQDPVPWHRKPNLRYLYLMMFPTCMGIELTSGFDSQMINALQIVPSWKACESGVWGLESRSVARPPVVPFTPTPRPHQVPPPPTPCLAPRCKVTS
jgi:hypothetical protein